MEASTPKREGMEHEGMEHVLDSKTPKLEGVEQVSEGWLNKYILTYRMPDGSLYEYEAVSRKGLDAYAKVLEENRSGEREGRGRPDGICIVPILEDGSILLIREFRYALDAWVIALPAGLVEPGEDPATCIDRELREETGYRLRQDPNGEGTLRILPQAGFSSAGMTDESVGIAIAKVEPCGKSDLQGEEMISAFTLKPSEVGPFLDSNTDAIGTRCQLVLEGMRGLFDNL